MEEDTIQLGYLEWCETEEPFFAKGGKQFDAAIKIAKNIVACDAALLKLLGVKCSVFNDSVVLSKGDFSEEDGIRVALSAPHFEGINSNAIVVAILNERGSGVDIYRKKIKNEETIYDLDSLSVHESKIYRTIGKALYFSLRY